jgi:hypothetical protein
MTELDTAMLTAVGLVLAIAIAAVCVIFEFLPDYIYKRFKSIREKETEEAEKNRYLEKSRMDYDAFEAWKSAQNNSFDAAGTEVGRAKLPPSGEPPRDGKSDNWY